MMNGEIFGKIFCNNLYTKIIANSTKIKLIIFTPIMLSGKQNAPIAKKNAYPKEGWEHKRKDSK